MTVDLVSTVTILTSIQTRVILARARKIQGGTVIMEEIAFAKATIAKLH